jgi:hypothetical protein
MTGIRHSNGTALVHIFGPRSSTDRGGAIALSLDDPDGNRLDYRKVEALANRENISQRRGCFCDPGTGEIAYDLRQSEIALAFYRPEPVSFDFFYD